MGRASRSALWIAAAAAAAAVGFLIFGGTPAGREGTEVPGIGDARPRPAGAPSDASSPRGAGPLATSEFTGDPPARAAWSFAGRVRSRDGAPLAGASVRVRVYAGLVAAEAFRLLGRDAVADREGAFAVSIEDPPSAATVTITAGLAGYRAASAVLALEPEHGPVAPLAFELEKEGARLALKVTDRSGHPLEGATVAATDLLDPVRTDAEGRASIPAGDREEGVIVAVSLAGFASARRRLRPAPTDSEHVVALEPGADLRVRVRDEGGTAVPGASMIAGGGAAREATGPDGVAVLSGLTAGDAVLPLRVRHPGFLPLDVAIDPRAAETHELRLARGAALEGRTVAGDGAPLRGVALSLLRTGDDEPVCTVSGEGGRFRFDGLGDGAQVLRATCPGHAAAILALERPPAPGREVLVRLETGLPIAGSIAGVDGGALGGATVRARTAGGGAVVAETRSEADGAFHLRVPAGPPVRVEAARFGLLDAAFEGVLPGREDLVLVLRPGGFLAGTVLATGGEPVPRFAVRVIPQAGAADAVPEPWRSEGASIESASGAFRSPNAFLEPGRAYHVIVKAEGFQAGSVREHVASADPSDPGFHLELAPAMRLRGTVLRAPTSMPLPGAVARVAAMDGDRIVEARILGEAVADAFGRFEIDGMAPGACALLLEGEGAVGVALPLGKLGAGPHEIGERSLSEPATLWVQVRDALGGPVAGVEVAVEVRPEPGSERGAALVLDRHRRGSGRTDAAGAVVFTGLAAGPARVVIAGGPPELAGLAREVALVPGEPAIVAVAAGGTAAEIAGTLTLPAEIRDPVRLRLSARGGNGPLPEALATVGLDRTFSFKGLAPGPYRLEAQIDHGRTRYRGSLDLDVAPGRNAVTLALVVD